MELGNWLNRISNRVSIRDYYTGENKWKGYYKIDIEYIQSRSNCVIT